MRPSSLYVQDNLTSLSGAQLPLQQGPAESGSVRCSRRVQAWQEVHRTSFPGFVGLSCPRLADEELSSPRRQVKSTSTIITFSMPTPQQPQSALIPKHRASRLLILPIRHHVPLSAHWPNPNPIVSSFYLSGIAIATIDLDQPNRSATTPISIADNPPCSRSPTPRCPSCSEGQRLARQQTCPSKPVITF